MNDKNKYQELIRVFESIEIENIETLFSVGNPLKAVGITAKTV